MALSTAASVVAAKRWIDDYIDLEQTIGELIRRKRELSEHSAEYQLIERELTGPRYSREEAGPIIENIYAGLLLSQRCQLNSGAYFEELYQSIFWFICVGRHFRNPPLSQNRTKFQSHHFVVTARRGVP
jgi:hypothetical protein